MEYSIEIHPWDIAEEGPARTLAQVASLGVKRLSLTAAWPGKAVLRPRAPAGRLLFPERGAVYFRPDEARWRDAPFRPVQAEMVLVEDYFDTLPEKAEREGLEVEARVVFLPLVPPPSSPARRPAAQAKGSQAERPFTVEKLYVRNAFGDRLPGYMCPAREEVRRYLTNLVCDVASRNVSSVAIESYGFPLFDFAGMPGAEVLSPSPAAQFLMGVCFCDACVARGEAMGIETSPLAWRVRNFLERVLSGEPGPAPLLSATPDGLAEIDELLPAYLRARNDIAGTLVRDMRVALRKDVSLAAFPGSQAPASQSWREGGEIARLSAGANVIRLQDTGPDPSALVQDVTHARDKTGGRSEVSVRLVPGPPLSPSLDALAGKLSAAKGLGLESVVFARYGELANAHLKWIPRAISSAG